MIRQLYREAKLPAPTEKVDKKTGAIFWGTDNLYPQFLMGLYSDNPVHSGIVNQKVKFITAGGIQVNTEEQMANGRSPYTLQEVVEIICRDNEITDAYAVLFKKDLVTGKWFCQPIDIELIRATEDGVWYEKSDDWSKAKQDPLKTGYRRYKNIQKMNSEDTEVLMYTITRPKQRIIPGKKELTANYYPTPTYSGAITSIMAGIEMDYFTYSEVVNSYKGEAVIALNNGVPETQQEEDEIINRIKNDATERDRQGGITILFAEGKDQAPDIHQLNGNDLDKRYIESNKEILRKIMIAHSVISPALFGVLSETMFGGKEEMEIAYKLFQENYAKYRQNSISEAFNWAWKKLNKEELGMIFKDYILNLEQNIEETNRTSAALNGMSPLLAGKVLENLTINEIRALASLAAIPTGDVIPSQVTAPAAFSNEDPVLDAFEKAGRSKDEFIILESREYSTDEDNEEDFKKSFLKDRYAMTVTDEDRNILQMIKNGESYDAISKAIGKGGVYLSKRLFQLKENGYIDGWELTDKGQREAVVITEIEVLYSYEKKPGIPGPAVLPDDRTRPFCKVMVESNKLFSREEIEEIGKAVERDVWLYRGGWYTNPLTERTTPSCRHIWKQNIVTVRR